MRCRLLLETEPRTGAMNMAVDEALLERVQAGESLPVLRFYTWRPYALSLGYFQRLADVDREACQREGIDLVRRPTGGRAVLHAEEVTYAVILPEATPGLPAGVTAAYRFLSAGLREGLRLLGLETEITARPETGKGAACFAAPSWYELTYAGKKLAGSAQVRREGVLLQHGSLPLRFDAAAVTRLLCFSSSAARERARRTLAARAAGLAEFCPQLPDPSAVMRALAEGFALALGWHWVDESGGLTPREQARAETLAQEKYGAEAWLARW